MYRKTRFVCVSDTHGYAPSEAGFKLPAGDVLIHAGDLTNQGSITELRKTMDWIAAADFEVKIVICGNHDITLSSSFYAEHGRRLHNKNPEDPDKCMEAVTTASSSVLFLKHESALVRLTQSGGPDTFFKIFGSPYSQFEGTWAFGYETDEAEALWRQIPLDADVVVTHTPPYSHRDRLVGGESVGCNSLRQALSRTRPLLAVCGHVHESRGYERIRWSLSSASSPTSDQVPEEETIEGVLPPPGSKKQSLVDLTGKKGLRLKNEGFCLRSNSSYLAAFAESSQKFLKFEPVNQGAEQPQSSISNQPTPGFLPSYLTEDQAAGEDRASKRQETCIVNAAIMASHWPHRGGRKFNTPIVVDLDLPVWSAQ